MEEIFKERQIFKQKVIEQVQHELNQFGLCIYNANVKELHDTPGSEYFGRDPSYPNLHRSRLTTSYSLSISKSPRGCI